MGRILSLGGLVAVCIASAATGTDEGNDAEVAAVRERIESYVSAFNGHDAGVLAAHWTEQAEYLPPLTERRIQGREAIGKAFAELFEKESKLRLRIAIQSVRLVDDIVAIEDGTATVVSPDAPPEQSGYTTVHVKKDGQWYRANVREVGIPAAPEGIVALKDLALKDLAWMVGDWQGAEEDSTLRIRCQWTGGGAFLSRLFTDGQTSGTQIIGWDPTIGQIRSWTFDSEGGFSEGLWSWQKDRWVIKATAVMPDGGAGSEQRILVPDGEDRFSWKSVQRQVSGRILPGTKAVTVGRVKKG